MDGQPFLYVNKEVDPGLIATLEQDVIPWLEANLRKTPEREQRLRDDARAHWFTVVFDREGYSPGDWRQSFFPVVLPHLEMLPKISLKNVTERLLMFCI